jgi:anti-sigma regulatory factor (Ser/Thr protein kinase)
VTVCLTDPADPRPSITVRLHGGTGAPLRARRSLLPQLEGQLTKTAVADVALILSELVTNSVMHANVGPGQTLTVECAPLADRLRITVTDPGARLKPHLRRPDHERSGGYGLAIVASLALAWGVVRHSAGTTSVWCELPLDNALSGLSIDRESTERCGSDDPECL